MAARSDFLIAEKTLREIASLCIHLDGLPLAIELAASRLKMLSCSDLLRMLPGRLALLKATSRDLPGRQQTLVSAIDWSHDLLGPAERLLFTRLSVFVGGCTLEAAESICSSWGSQPELDVLDCITSLVDNSLLRVTEGRRESRFWMLETIQEYALTKLAAGPATEALKERHAAYYLALAEEGAGALHGPDQMDWLDRLEREYGNLQAALERYLGSGRPWEALRLCTALEWFWYRYAHFSDARRWLTAALKLATERGLPAASHPGASLPASTTPTPGDEDGWRQVQIAAGRALRALAWLLMVQGEWPQAKDSYQESLATAKRWGDARGEVLALSGLGVAERWLGERSAGSGHVEAAVQLARELRDPLSIALSLIWAYSTTGGKYSGEPPLAQLEEALELARRLGDPWCVAHAFNGLGDLLTELGDYKSARVNYEKALKSFRELSDDWLVAWQLEGLARVSLLDGDCEGAVRTTQESLRLFDEIGDRANVVFMMGRLGMVLRRAGCRARATSILGAFERLEREILGAANRGAHSPDLAAALSTCKEAASESWAAGQAMSYAQALAYSLASPDAGKE